MRCVAIQAFECTYGLTYSSSVPPHIPGSPSGIILLPISRSCGLRQRPTSIRCSSSALYDRCAVYRGTCKNLFDLRRVTVLRSHHVAALGAPPETTSKRLTTVRDAPERFTQTTCQHRIVRG
jgi:hypothetical protein